MNGAEAFIQTLKLCGVEVCFANPGTSEMQLVAAIDQTPGMRAILGLFEGVVTGAADGYGRIAQAPAPVALPLQEQRRAGAAKPAHRPISARTEASMSALEKGLVMNRSTPARSAASR